MTEPEFPPITLKTDARVGVYFLCDEDGADDLRDGLEGDRVEFSFNPPEGAHLAEAGNVLFAFGKAHPRLVAEALETIGEEVVIDPATAMPEDAYHPPVKQLLPLGEVDREQKLDYVALGLSLNDVPALIRLATDELLYDGPQDSPVFWSPIHAWRALGQLRPGEAIAPLVELFRRLDEGIDEWVSDDLAEALVQFGALALAPLTDYLADAAHGEWARVAAGKTIGLIGEAHPELRADCVARLSAQLDRFAEQSETLNALLISSLWDLRAVEAMPVIERAFASGRVDESVQGDVEDVQIKFGLKTKREHPPKPNSLTILGEKLRARWRAAGLPLPDADGNFSETEDVFHDSVVGPPALSRPHIAPRKVGRNDPCPCGSGKKFKKCCGG